ncbi:hypothetical protein V9T40_000542 [Parthenolecanium corni]|uniref:C2H2-type domain-containing protein n=1 Tax=Parthenolecanium corni TaxID=536013 RepID=A0AAN9Y1U3_9HEMI
MHKLEEIYWEEQSIDDIEVNLFEPECIITDNPKDEFSIFALEDRSVETSIRGICIEANNAHNFSVPSNLRDSLTIRPVTKPVVSSHNDSVYSNGSVFNTASTLSNMYLDELEMHSIFTPDKQTKPKEIFTQCHVCGKYVIVRMCPETGVYSKCRYCFNSPFSNTEDVIFENLNVLPDGIEPEVTITTMDLNVPNEEPAPPPPQASGANGGGHSKSNGSFKCEHCGKLFTRNWYLKQHIKLHSNDKPYSCEMCDKRFLNSSNLKQHMKTHSVEYRCHICNRTYHSQSVLNQHLCKN